MKKLSLILVLLTIGIVPLFAQDATEAVKDPKWKEVTEQVGEVTSDAVASLYDGVKTVVRDIGGALKVPAEHVYRVLVKQQIVKSVGYLLITLLPIWFIWKGNTIIKLEDKTDHDIGFTMIIIAGIALAVYLLCVGQTIITGLVNPEYGALHEILELVK